MEEGVIYGSTPSPQVPQQNNQAAKSSIVSYAQSQTPPPKPKPKTSKLKKILLIFLSLFLLITVVFSLIYFISLRSGEEATEKVELVWWGMWEDEAIPQSIITDFETKNPNVKVKYEYQEPAEFKEKLIARTDAGRGPDIFRFHTNWYEDLSGILLPLTSDVITKEEFEKNYYKTAQRDLIKNGAIVGIPLEVDTLALFVNPAIIEQIKTEKELLEIKLPTNWQEFIETTETLTTYDELGKIIIGGAGMGSYDNVNYAPDIISLLFAQNRVDFDNFTSNQTRASDALRFYTNFALIENNVWAANIDPDLLAFSQGRLAMYYGYSKDYNQIKKSNPGLNFQVIAVPQLLSKEKFAISSYFVEGVSNASTSQAEAMLFMKFLKSPGAQEKLYQEQLKKGIFPPPYSNKSLNEKLRGTDAYVFAQQANYALSAPFMLTPEKESRGEGMNKFIKDAVNSILSGTEPDFVTEDMFLALTGAEPTGEITENIPKILPEVEE